jgi:hypothetical protein
MPPTGGKDTTAGLGGIAVEGAADFFFSRPLDQNPCEAEACWEAWWFGGLEASWFNEMRGDVERRRWQSAA